MGGPFAECGGGYQPIAVRETRILLVRPDHLGDVLLTLPAVRALRHRLPSAPLAYLAAPGPGGLLRRCPDVDEVLTAPFPAPDADGQPRGWEREVGEVAAGLRSRFDVAVLLRPDDRWSGEVAVRGGIPRRVGLTRRPGTPPFLTDAVPEPRGHAVDIAWAAVAAALDAVGADLDGLRPGQPRIRPTAGDVSSVRRKLSGPLREAGPQPVVLHPGSGWRLKDWPPDRWTSLAEAVGERYGVAPLVVGAPGEEALIERIAGEERAPQARWRGDARPRRRTAPLPVTGLDLGELASLHAAARVVVSTDSGAMHLAALMGTAVVGLFGPGDPAMAAPWCPPEQGRIVRVVLPCSPCGTMHDPPCGASALPACVTGIDVPSVLRAIDEVAGRPAA